MGNNDHLVIRERPSLKNDFLPITGESCSRNFNSVTGKDSVYSVWMPKKLKPSKSADKLH